jgi:hypothetical protein
MYCMCGKIYTDIARGPLIYVAITYVLYTRLNGWRIACGRGGLYIYMLYDPNPGAREVMPIPMN